MAKIRYKCPECDFTARLGQLHSHLRAHPMHWMIRCELCDKPFISKKDFESHKIEFGHDPVSVKRSDLVNVQNYTKVADIDIAKANKKRSNPKTKNSLVKLGIDPVIANLLSEGTTWEQLSSLNLKQFEQRLSHRHYDTKKDIITRVNPRLYFKIKSATKTKLMKLGLKEKIATSLARGHNWADLKLLTKSEIVRLVLPYTPREEIEMAAVILGTKNDMLQKNWYSEINPRSWIDECSLRGLTLSNFKGFRPRHENHTFVPLRPLTLVFGPNNGGKSSVLKAFSSIPQTISKRKMLDGDYDWSPDGIWFDLGAAPHILNKPDQTSFSIGFVVEAKLAPMAPGKLSKPISEYVESSYHEVRCNFEMRNNSGLLTSFVYSKGNFEDYLEQVLKFVFDDTNIKISSISESLKNDSKKHDNLLSQGNALMIEFQELLDDLESDGAFHKRASKGLLTKTQRKQIKAFHRAAGGDVQVNDVNIIPKWIMAVKTLSTIIDGNPDTISLLREGGSESFSIFTNEYFPKASEYFKSIPKQFVSKMKWDITSLLSGRPEWILEGNPVLDNEMSILNKILTMIHKQLAEIDYLGATRLVSKRYYSSRTGNQTSQGVAGQRTLALLANNLELQKKVNEDLAKLVDLNVKVNRRHTTITLADGSEKTYPIDELDVRVSRTNSQEDRLQLPDVGFGVSQLLPVLTGIRSPGRLVIEEPESNLHPSAQQKLMSTIIEQVCSAEGGPVLMETHSEHFLLEVLRAIADPKCPLQDDDVSILYTYNTPEHGTLVKRHTTTNGTLDERFPKEFTGDYGLSLI